MAAFDGGCTAIFPIEARLDEGVPARSTVSSTAPSPKRPHAPCAAPRKEAARKRDGRAPRKPRKPPLGQHFLRDAAVLDRLLAAIPDDGLPLIEIGAGDGSLTLPLAQLGRPLAAVEFDDRLARPTARALVDYPNARLIVADILDLVPAQLLRHRAAPHDTPPQETPPEKTPPEKTPPAITNGGAAPPYGLVGNLPYAIAAPIFRRFLSVPAHRPRWMLVMVQHEVALQVVAPPGKRSLLSLSVQLYADPQLLFSVDRFAFDPPPQVRSAVLFIPLHHAPAVDLPSEERFFEVACAAFRAPRKQLRNALALGFSIPAAEAEAWLRACAVDPARRPGTLTLQEWAALAWARERQGAPAPQPARPL